MHSNGNNVYCVLNPRQVVERENATSSREGKAREGWHKMIRLGIVGMWQVPFSVIELLFDESIPLIRSDHAMAHLFIVHIHTLFHLPTKPVREVVMRSKESMTCFHVAG